MIPLQDLIAAAVGTRVQHGGSTWQKVQPEHWQICAADCEPLPYAGVVRQVDLFLVFADGRATADELEIVLAEQRKRQNLARKGQWFVEWGLVIDACERIATVRAALTEHEDAHLAEPAWVLAGTVQGLGYALSLLDFRGVC